MSDDISIPRPGFAAQRRTEGLEPGAKRLIWIAGGLVVGLAGIVGAATLIGRKSADVPVVQADNRPVRVKPDNPGGMQIAGSANETFSPGDGAGKLAPAPETPDPKALRAPPPPPPAAVAQTTPMAAPPTAERVAVQPPAPPVAKPAATAAAAKPVAKPAAKGPAVQLAAVTSETSAKTEWQNLTKKMPDVLGGRQPVFTKSEHDGKTWWRVRTGGFADVAAAKSFCERVKTKGGACTVQDI